MLRALGWLLAVLVLAACCWWLYMHATSHPVSTSGDVFPHDTSDTKDSADEAVSAAKPEPAAAPVQPAPQPVETPAAATMPPTAPTIASPATPTTLPVTDSINRDPPVGMAFGGNGKYQWYRQGDITWRINTASGASCIDFATMEQWSKPVVYSHGCGRS